MLFLYYWGIIIIIVALTVFYILFYFSKHVFKSNKCFVLVLIYYINSVSWHIFHKCPVDYYFVVIENINFHMGLEKHEGG